MTESLSDERIREALDTLEVDYLTSRHGHPYALFDETGERPALGALVTGSDGVLALSVNPHVPTSHVPADCLAAFCNRWNNSCRWPTASIGNRPNGTSRLDVRANTVILGGIDDQQLAATLRVHLDGAKVFTRRLGELARNTDWVLDDQLLGALLADADTTRGVPEPEV